MDDPSAAKRLTKQRPPSAARSSMIESTGLRPYNPAPAPSTYQHMPTSNNSFNSNFNTPLHPALQHQHPHLQSAATSGSRSSQSISSASSSSSSAAAYRPPTLQRHPSAPVYPRSHASANYARATAPSQMTSPISPANGALDRQPIAPPSLLAAASFTTPQYGASQHYYGDASHLSPRTSDDLIGQPFDSTAILNHFDPSKPSPSMQSPPRRPAPPPLTQTPDARSPPPHLRASMSFSSGDEAPRSRLTSPSDIGTPIMTPQSFTYPSAPEENKEPRRGMLRKKSGFSRVMSSIGVGSPKGVKISAPENPVHVTHVGFDNSTGQFTVRLDTWEHAHANIWTGSSARMATSHHRKRHHQT